MPRKRTFTKPQKKKRRLLLSLIIISFVFISLLSFLISLPIFNITSVTVEGTRLLYQDDIIRIAGIPTGDNIFLVNLSKVSKEIKKIPIVKSVGISRIFPSRIAITIEERKESFICTTKGQSLILDESGVVLNPSNIDSYRLDFPDITKLPVMSGIPEAWVASGEVGVEDGKDLLKLLADFKTFVVPQKLQVNIKDLSNVTLFVDDVLSVKLGTVDNLTEKMRVFEKIYGKIKGKGTIPSYIDVSSYKFPVVRL